MYHSNSHRLPSPKEISDKYGVHFHVHHLHDGNDDKEMRDVFARGAKYVTVCRITKPEGVGKDGALAVGVAICSKLDTPNRKLGHRIAVSRAIKKFLETAPALVEEDKVAMEGV